MKKESTGKRLAEEIVMFGLLGAVWFSPTAVGIWQNSKFKDIGEGYKVRETGNQREFYIGTTCGQARLVVDENKDGTLDKTLINAPISPYMGGPGYRTMGTETTASDREKFTRANYLLSQAK